MKSVLDNCPDPDRSQKNIETFLSENPAHTERLNSSLPQVAALFSYSQFLANYCIRNPGALFSALERPEAPFDAGQLSNELRELLSPCGSLEEGMRAVRSFKKDTLLAITLKDVLKHAELREILPDLSNLADAVLSESLAFVEEFLMQRYGAPGDNSLTVVSLGKLGARELNYSSDVDIVFAYRNEGETSGISTIPGVTRNKISAFEYYAKLVEEFSRFLSANTADGFAYRVDLRLRPQGQRGGLALAIRGYEEYYESWGQLWERAALLRARPVAGDSGLGELFLETIKPFVYRKYLDFQAIDEIRRMKSQVEQIKAGTLSRDIKRGYGGIREIEFFIQIFQLIYGGREPLLRERGTLMALHRLLQKGLIGYDDFRYLSENYIFLRTLEHRLQQLNDIQTHTLPSGDRDLEVLGRKMGFNGREDFLPALDAGRRRVRSIYDSLLEVHGRQAEGERAPEGLLSDVFWDMETPVEHLLTEELSKTDIRDIPKAIRHLIKIRNTIYSFQTIKGRRLLEHVLPAFIDEAVRGADPDLALLHLVDFSALMATKESYLEAIHERREIISALIFIFSHSEYLSKIIMGNPGYLESLVAGEIRKKTCRMLKDELGLLIGTHGESTAIRLFRRLEEIRLGTLYLNGKLGIRELTDALSKTAEAVLLALLTGHGAGDRGLTIIGFGKLGGREITFNSDLDIVFITPGEPEEADIRAAERLLKASMSYTKDGVAYSIDTRLRPEGSKGPLVSSAEGIAEYYARHAQVWELQALLKARPLSCGNFHLRPARSFMEMREKVLTERGSELTPSDIRKMRERIQRELAKDSDKLQVTSNRLKNKKESENSSLVTRYPLPPFDVKLGSGGLEDLEFLVQYLQLKNCRTYPGLLVQGTFNALRRLNKAGVLKERDAAVLEDAYLFYRNIETILRLRNEPLLREGSNALKTTVDIMGADREKFLGCLAEKRQQVKGFWDTLRS